MRQAGTLSPTRRAVPCSNTSGQRLLQRPLVPRRAYDCSPSGRKRRLGRSLRSVERPGLSPSLGTLSFRELFEPMDLVYAGPAAAWPLAEALVRQGKSVSLPRLPATSPVIPALRAAFRGRGVVIVTPAAGYP